jgi:cob(I)alamin adenosyltransferase
MRLDKIYTKVGDRGQTMLANGEKISKAALRIEAYGTVDELNATCAMLRDQLDQTGKFELVELSKQILLIQNELFDIGGELATPMSALNQSKQQLVQHKSVARLEAEMDEMNKHLDPLSNFVLPGGHPANSVAHLARCVCRRAEREVVRLSDQEEVRAESRIYLNRLSDWLFLVSRIISKYLDCPEILWLQNK